MGARRILVVDDCADTVETVSTLLEILGHECVGAATGVAAIERAMRFDPDVVLLDLQLPDLSGFEVARQLRARCRRRAYLAAFTGWGGTRVQQRMHEAGFDQHLLKPIDKDALCDVVRKARASISLVHDARTRNSDRACAVEGGECTHARECAEP